MTKGLVSRTPPLGPPRPTSAPRAPALPGPVLPQLTAHDWPRQVPLLCATEVFPQLLAALLSLFRGSEDFCRARAGSSLVQGLETGPCFFPVEKLRRPEVCAHSHPLVPQEPVGLSWR